MNIECQSCHAKYAVPDDKVKGRKVKIACKKCKAPIIVDGTAPAEGTQRPRQNTMLGVAPVSGSGDKASQRAATSAKAAEVWTVAVTDDQHEQMTLEQFISAYSKEKIDADTFVWREGMTDWVGPFEVPELAAALAEKGFQEPPRVPDNDLSSAPEEPEASSGSAAEEDDELPTMVAGAGDFANMMGTKHPVAAPQRTPSLPPAKPSAAFARLPTAPSIAAARAATNDSLGFDLGEPPRSKAGPDLFARAATAGSEADVHAQPAHKAPTNSGLTGARNENSVLFSLDALVGGSSQAQPKSDDVNVEDLLSMPSMEDAAPSSITNLTAGNFMLGSSGPLIQPDAAIVPEPVAPKVASAFTSMPPAGRTVSSPPKRGGSVVGVVGGLLFLGVLGYLGYTYLQTGSLMPREVAALIGQPAQEPPTVAPAEATLPPTSAQATATAEPSAAPIGDSAMAGAAGLAAGKPSTGQTGTVPTPTPLTGSQNGAATPTPGPVPSPSPVAPAPTPLPTPGPGASPSPAKPTEAAASALPPFDVSEAKSALAAAAATASASCKQPNGPTGDGPVQVTFNPSGRATNAVVGGAFKGTVVGGCIARIFRTARVSKFSGEQRTVSKTVYIK